MANRNDWRGSTPLVNGRYPAASPPSGFKTRSQLATAEWKKGQRKARVMGKRINVAAQLDMTDFDLVSEKMVRASQHYEGVTGYRASTMIEGQILRKIKPVAAGIISEAAATAPRGGRSKSGDLRKPAAYIYKPKNKLRKSDLYGFTIQVGGAKGKSTAVSKRVTPYAHFPFWQGGQTIGYGWTSPKEWLWRAADRKGADVAQAARSGLEVSYEALWNAKPGEFGL